MLRPSLSRVGIERWLRYTMVFGVFILIVGMAIPAPEHVYEYLFILTLFLPGLLMMALRPSSLQILWRSPSIKWVFLLLAWSAISLAWSSTDQVIDWIGRCLGIFLFLYCWVRVFTEREEYLHRFLFVSGIFMALVALVALAIYFPQVIAGGRIQGFSSIKNTNQAAPFMSVAALWLCTFPLSRLAYRIARALVVAVLLTFVCVTFSRGAWGALFVALLVVAACGKGRGDRWLLVGMAVLGGVAVVTFLPELLQRGWSYRPMILQHSWEMFWQHPWLGIGQGSLTHFHIDGYVFNHTQNMFAQIAVQLGFPGAVALLCIWLPLGWRGWYYRHKPLGRLMLGMWVFTTIQGQVELAYMINSPGTEWLCAWIPVAIGCVLSASAPRKAEMGTLGGESQSTSGATN